MRKCIFVCSAFAGDVAKNVENAKRYCQFVMEKGHAPFAPHLLYPQMLDDGCAESRELGMDCGMAFLRRCQEVWVFSTDRTLSKGMVAEVDEAIHYGIPIEWFLDFPRE